MEGSRPTSKLLLSCLVHLFGVTDIHLTESCVILSLRYSIIVSFTLENQGLRGIMTNYGYSLPDAEHTRRQSIWFTGGTIEPADEDEESIEAWKKVFGANAAEEKSEENPQCAEKAKLLAQKILLGAVSEPMDEYGVIGFHLCRPIGGHSSAFCDVVYMDNDLRVMKGHSGSVYVFKRTEFH